MNKFIVIGNPIAHSLSPEIHQAFALQCGIKLQYEKMLAEIDNFNVTLDEFRQQGGDGANITLPFKQQAFHYVDACSERAKCAQAVNTIKFINDGTSYGDNTDGAGLVNDLLNNLHWPIRDQRILIVGAGGAVRGILAPLAQQAPREIIIFNRTEEKAQVLMQEFNQDYRMIRAFTGKLDNTKLSHVDLIINGTSSGLTGKMTLLPENSQLKKMRCYDLVYACNKLTTFCQTVKEYACVNYSDGLGMLVEQAAEAFYLWHGVRPETQPVIKKLRM